MGSYTFRWPYNANEVFVTGTFDDWGKTIRLDRKGDVFEKEVHLPVTGDKVHFKFVVDGNWTTDNRLPQEDDGSSNINNILYPDQIQADSVAALQNGAQDMATASGVTPNATTAGLAGGVSKESNLAPGSTTAGLDKDVPLEQRANVPGGFPADTPLSEYSVNPIPASSGIGNPIHLKPGEKVPDSSTFNPNTVQSTVRTHDTNESHAQYSSGLGSSFSVPPASNTMIPESSLPMGSGTNSAPADPGVTVQSAAPTSTTAGLAANVPFENKKQTDSTGPVEDVPAIVRESISKAHRDPEAAAQQEVVDEKKELEHELQQKVQVADSAGEPAPTTTAATTETAPRASVAEPSSAEMSPRTGTPSGAKASNTGAPQPGESNTGAPATGASTTGGETKKSTTSANDSKTSEVPSTGSPGKEEKKKKRSSIFAKLKEKFK
ncbi:carbohydrate-binding module family 48 protein [Aspergillus foveolatus]|uniref:carbohydrate-binding module family 48 protein n=1 Tax=Aspergillus foveolatus TaxID=210207 RepID=UPI003CCDC737